MVKSLQDNKIGDELPKGERIKMCKEVLEVVRREVPEIHSHGKNNVEGQKKYLVHLMTLGRRVRYSIKILPAYKCPTSPAIYIHVKSYNKITGNMEFLVITKGTVPAPDLKYIRSYAIKSVESITEAFSEEIPKKTTESDNPGISAIDADEFPEKQRLQICERAATTISERKATFLENAVAGINKLYTVKEKRATDHRLFSSIVHAFRCPTYPEIYVHIEMEEDDEKTLWTFTTESEQNPPIFDVYGFLLQPILHATAVSPDVLEALGDYDDKFSVNFDELGEEARRQMCNKSVLVTLGTRVNVLENAEVEQSKLYTVEMETGEEIILRAIKCPTLSSVEVYIHIKTHHDVGNLSWVFLRKNEQYEELSPWI